MSLSICQRVVINKGINIDELQIEVSTSSDKAEKSIDRLRKLIDKLQESTEKCTGLTKIRNQMNKIAEIGNKIEKINVGSEKMQKLVSTINSLNNIQTPNLTKLRNQMNKLSEIKEQINNLPDVSDNVSHFVNSIKPLETLGNVNVNSYIKLFNKLPEISESLKNTDFSDFSKNLLQVANSIAPLANQMEKLGMGYSALPQNIKSVISSNQQLAKSNERVTTTQVTLTSILEKTKIKVLIYYQALNRLSNALSDCLTESNAYVENLNLFTVSMGKGAKEALNYAESVNKALGIDTSEWIRNQGVFKQITSGFGVVNDKSDVISKNLTQLGYDISSFFNINIDESMQKLQSGISGELEPLRRLGYALDAATLQQVAYANGITTSINKMTQAQKSQLRYIAILQQSQNVMGDMARTVITPANSLRILEQQFTQLKRAIGNVVSVVAVRLIPYVQVAVRLLTDFANWLAKKWGFELPTIDYSNVGNGLSSISDEADNATESVKETAKQMKMLAGFDELNILSDSKSDKENISDSIGNADLGIKLPEYDFLAGADKSTDKLYEKAKEKIKELVEKLKDLKQWIIDNRDRLKELGSLLVGIWAVKKLSTFVGWIKKLWGWTKQLKAFQLAKRWVEEFLKGFKTSNATTAIGKLGDGFKKATGKIKTWRQQLSPATRLLGTIAGSALAGVGSYNLFKDLATDTASWKSVLGDSAMIVGGLGMSWIFGGLPGLGVGLLVTAFSGLYGYIKGCDEEQEKLEKEFINSQLYGNGGTKISEIAGAFSNMKSDLDGSLQPLKDLQTEIDNTNKKINEDQFFVDTYLAKLQNNEPLTKTEIEEMQGHFNGLIENMKTNMELNTDLIYENFHNSAVDAAEQLGYDIDEMENILDGFKEKYSNELDSVKEEQNKLFEKMTTGGGLTDKEKEQFISNIEYISDMSHKMTDDEYNFRNIADNLGNIDYENPEKTKEALSTIKESTQNMISEIGEANKDAQKAILENKEHLGLMLDRGSISKKYYDSVCKTLDQYSESIEKGYEAKKQGIANQYATVLSAIKQNIQDQIDETVDKIEPKTSEKAKQFVNEVWNGLTIGIFGSDEFTNGYYGMDAKDFRKDRLTEEYSDSLKEYMEYSEELSNKYGDSIGEYSSEILAFMEKYGAEASLKVLNCYGDTGKKSLDELKKLGVEVDVELIKDLKKIGVKFDDELKNITNKIAQKAPAIKDQINKLFSFTQSSNPLLQIGGIGAIYGLGAIHGYASGGFPTTGQLFVARENGIPEMVGKIGNQTAVANNGQIEQGIANAVYKAMSSAIGGPVNSEHPINVTVPVYIDGQKIDEQQYSYRQRQLVRSNGRREY